MILVAHSLIGAAVTRPLTNSIAIFIAGLASHYLSDMIPHWHYRTPHVDKYTDSKYDERIIKFKKKYIVDAVIIGVDLGMGFVLSFYLFGVSWSIFWAVLGATFPDLLVGASRFIPFRPLQLHSKVHRRIHSRIRLDDEPVFGLTSQAAITSAVVFLFIVF